MFKSQKLHAFLLKSGSLQNDIYRCNLLLQSYINSGSLSVANKLLHLLPHSNVISYNTLISGLFASNQIHQALKLFSTAPETDTRSWNIVISACIRNPLSKHYAVTLFLRMRRSRTSSSSSNIIKPDHFTYASLIPCCDLELGRQVHGEVIKVCSSADAFIGTNLLRLYAEAGKIEDVQKVFDEMCCCRDLVTWNVLISCYSKFGKGEMSLELFRQLFREGILADEFTYAIVLNEFASRSQVFEAMQVHSLMIRFGFCSDRFLNNSLVNLYSKSGFVASATRLFEGMAVRDVVSWTSMIVGFSQSGLDKEAILLFGEMRLAEVEPNSFTFGSLFSACGNTTAFTMGKQLHSLVLRYGLETDIVVGSAIVDMYSKCGEMKDASRLFRWLPERDLVTWNGMICGFAQNGEALKALKLFDEMVQSKPTSVVPNHVTFIGVLSACSHSGLVNEGSFYFRKMVHEYSIKPKAEHYTCMVDIFARAGLLEEAKTLILSSPFKTDNVIWGSLLGACKLRGNLVMARSIANRLFTCEPENSSNYVLLANTCTENREWDDALQVREVMNDRGAQKVVGCSWIEIRNCVHSFIAGHKDHPEYSLVREVLQRLLLQITDM